MSNPVNFKPQQYHTLTPYIVLHNAPDLIAFIQRVFDGEIVEQMLRPDGSVMHAELRIGDSMVMMAEAGPNDRLFPAMLHLYVPDIDATYQRSLQAGAVSIREPADQFYGDRSAGVEDRFGNQWWLATHFEDVSIEEMQRRAAAMP